MTTASLGARLASAVLSDNERRRIRLLQCLASVAVYAFSGGVMWLGVRASLVSGPGLAAWALFVACGLSLFYALLRSGWSERFADPALTGSQIAFAVLAVMWGYLICGEVRSAALFPLMFIFTFGAFSLTWRRLAALTVFALACLAATIVVLNRGPGSGNGFDVDVSNLLGVTVLLPACSWIAARLSALRMKLQRQRAELARALEEVQRLATHDELTGLVNRRRMLEVMQLEHQRCMRSGHPFCVAVVDLDHFKQVNDQHGHPAGDAVLRGFAGEALAAIRISDVLARWGGEEFLMLMSDTRGPLARLCVERLRERAEALRVGVEGRLLQVTVSAGVTEHRAGESLEDTIARADHALYAAKSGGRNQVVLH